MLPELRPPSLDEIKAQAIDLTEGIDQTRPGTDGATVVGLFPSETALLKAVAAVRAAGHQQIQAWTPWPVHGLDPAMGLQRSLIGRPVFTVSLFGFLFTFIGIAFLMTQDWTVIYGGKPFFTWQLWVVPTLEAGLLFGAVINLKACFAVCKLLPDPFTRIPDPRLTDDQFGLGVAGIGIAAAEALLRANGATEIRVVDAGMASGAPVFTALGTAPRESAHA